jgi:hypothetical protein
MISAKKIVVVIAAVVVVAAAGTYFGLTALENELKPAHDLDSDFDLFMDVEFSGTELNDNAI